MISSRQRGGVAALVSWTLTATAAALVLPASAVVPVGRAALQQRGGIVRRN